MNRRRVSRLLAPVAVALVVLAPTEPLDIAPDGVEVLARTESRSFFPLGWYDRLGKTDHLDEIADEGMNTVLPYDNQSGKPGAYLDAAKKAGLRVIVEIPRTLVRARDAAGIGAFVRRYNNHPALLAWYLADEPTSTPTLGPLPASEAGPLYGAIKGNDERPVAIAFSAGQDPAAFRDAMDVVMYDDYPVRAEHDEFERFYAWTHRVLDRGRIASEEDGFIPVLQAFGGPPEAPVAGRRLPTEDEQRYMVYTSLQAGATGLLFWARYRADETWVREVLMPIVDELGPMLPALAAGALRTETSVRGDRTAISLYRDPETQDIFLLAVHRGTGTVPVTIALDRTLRLRSRRTIRAELGPFEARVFRLRAVVTRAPSR